MKERELREHAKCSRCKNRIGHTGLPLFWSVSIQRHGIKAGPLQRQAGLTALLGGSAALAMAMGADEDMTEVLVNEDITLCENCAMEIMTLLERCGR